MIHRCDSSQIITPLATEIDLKFELSLIKFIILLRKGLVPMLTKVNNIIYRTPNLG